MTKKADRYPGVTEFKPDKAVQERLRKALRDYAPSFKENFGRPVPPRCNCHHCQYFGLVG